jgi:hypothetical protein
MASDSDSETDRVKLILTYDILPETQDLYYQFVLGEMVPAVQRMGLMMSGAWHTAYGDYPIRLVEFIGEDLEQVQAVLANPRWAAYERRLQEYVTRYSRKVVPLREDQFQF